VAVQELFQWAGGLDVFGVKVDHVAGREGWCGGVAAVVIPCHIVLCLSECRLGFLKGVLHPIHEFTNRFEAGRGLMWFEAHLRVSAGIKEEGCLLRGRVDVVIVGELCQGEECIPVVLSFSDEELQVLFQFLVDRFRLTVGLRVISGRRHGFDS